MLNINASELNRFMACNGFKSLQTVEPFQPDNTSKLEGDTTHWYCEQRKAGKTAEELLGIKAPTGMFITEEMIEHCSQYVNDIMDGGVVEYARTYESEKFTVKSRADYIKLDGDTLHVYDFKYGHKIVEPDNNWTLIWYAGSYKPDNTDGYYNQIKKIVFRIYQPRGFHPSGENVREWTITRDEFDSIKQTLFNTLNNPADTVNCGQHCYRCKALTNCPAAQISAMNSIDMSNQTFDSEVSDVNLTWLLNNLKRAKELINESLKAYEDLALHRLKAGKPLKGYVMQRAIGNRKWKQDVTPETIKLLTGIDVTAKQIVSITKAENLGLDEQTLKSFTYRPDNGFKLASVDENKQAEKYFRTKEK